MAPLRDAVSQRFSEIVLDYQITFSKKVKQKQIIRDCQITFSKKVKQKQIIRDCQRLSKIILDY